MKRLLIMIVVLGLMTGCASSPGFVYKPPAPVVNGLRFPVKVAVLPFKDVTEDFTTRGSIFAPDGLTLNLVKAGIPGTSSALTPELWAKSFADDLTASGDFQSVKFVYSLSELVDEGLYIGGAVEKAYAIGTWDKPNKIALSIRAFRKADNSLVWEKEVTKVWTPNIIMPCGLGIQCVIDQRYKDINRVMQGLFEEARIDLIRTLASSSESRAGEESLPAPSSPASPESLEGTIERILNGKPD